MLTCPLHPRLPNFELGTVSNTCRNIYTISKYSLRGGWRSHRLLECLADLGIEGRVEEVIVWVELAEFMLRKQALGSRAVAGVPVSNISGRTSLDTNSYGIKCWVQGERRGVGERSQRSTYTVKQSNMKPRA